MKRTNETGRSMVEMLGVLAIIGVLSVGGIAGYTMAMNRYRANEVIDLANKYAVVTFSAYESNRALNNGTATNFKTPSFCDTGLIATTSSTDTACKVNGTTIGKAQLMPTTNCTGTAIADTGSTEAKSIKIELSFDADANSVCKAAGSILGAPCEGNKVTFCSRNS